MKKRLLSIFLLIFFILSCTHVTSFATTITIHGPSTVVTPMDGSFVKVKYTLINEYGEEITDGVNWSADGGLVVMSDGSLILHHSENTNTGEYSVLPGKYTLRATYNGLSTSYNITVRDGLYNSSVLTGKQTIQYTTYNNGLKSDFTLEFKLKATEKATKYIVGFTVDDSINNDYFLLYLDNSVADENYKFYFRNYTGTGGSDYTATDSVTTDVPHGEWISIKFIAKKDSTVNANVKFDTYYADVDNNGNVGAYKLLCADVNPRYTQWYKGFYAFRTQNLSYLSIDDFSVYTGERFDMESAEYKYSDLHIVGKNANEDTDTYTLPRKSVDVTHKYELVNFINKPLSSEATWSVSPEGNGVIINSDGMLNIANDALPGDYIVKASVADREVTRQINIFADEYKLLLSGSDGYVFDHTFEGKKFYFNAFDQNTTPASVTWSLSESSEGVSISKTHSGLGELVVTSDAAPGTYTIKAVANPDEGFDVDTATKIFTLSQAGYSIVGHDTVTIPQSGYNQVQYNLVSDLGNSVVSNLKWSCDSGEILNDGRLITSKLTPSALKIKAVYNDVSYEKNISLSLGNNATGTPYDRSIVYTGNASMSVSSGLNEKTLFANAKEDGIANPAAKINWKILRLSDELQDYSSNVLISGSKLIVNGALQGTIYIEGTIENTLASTGEIPITLVNAFSTLNNDILTLKGLPGESITVNHHKPETGNFVTASLGYASVPEKAELTVDSDGEITYQIPLSSSGIHFVTVKKGSYEDEYTIYVNTDKLFEQPDVRTLLSDSRIKEYHIKYSTASGTTIETVSDLYQAFDSSEKDLVLMLAQNSYSKYFASVLTVQLMSGDITGAKLLKQELDNINLETAWIDILVKDPNIGEVGADVLSGLTNLDVLSDLVTEKLVLIGIKNSSTSNTKEAKPYLAMAGSSKYDNANDTHKNTIASSVAGKTYSSLSELLNAIDSVNLPLPDDGLSQNGPSSQKGTVGTVSSAITPSIPQTPASIYNDMSTEHWAYNYINSLTDKGIISGYAGNVFLPENNVTRAEFVKMLVNAFNVPSFSEEPFEDVQNEDWYSPYVSGAYNAGLVLGDGTKFHPDSLITRQDAAVMIYRFAIYAGVQFDNSDNAFTDNHIFSEYAVDAIDALSSRGIINGMPDGSFAPLLNATRAEASKMIYTAMEKGGIE